MRIRSTKPDFYRSKTIAQLSWAHRFFLKALESYVDDNGVGKHDIALIAADVVPRDLSASPTETLARVYEALSTFAEAGLVVLYEYDGEDLLYIDRWRTLQRIDKPTAPRFPRPDGSYAYSEDVSRESYGSPREPIARTLEVVAPGVGVGVGVGVGEGEGKEEVRDEVAHVCSHLADRIEANGSKRPTIGKRWTNDARLMLDTDRRPTDEVHRIIDWCQDSDFWRANIMSVGKLREKYDALRLQAGQSIQPERPRSRFVIDYDDPTNGRLTSND